MANDNLNLGEKVLKFSFQLAAAAVAPLIAEPCNRAFEQTGFAYDYYSTKLKLATGPK